MNETRIAISSPARRAGLRRLAALGLAAALLPAAAVAAPAANWPSKPVRVVVPYAPGGIADIAARSVAQKLAEQTGQPFVVENKPGADTRIGTEFVARAAGDDHLLLLAGGGFAVNNALFDKLPYDTAKDFVPIGLVVSNPLLLVTGANQPYAKVSDFVDAARAGKPVTLASGGRGTLSHMSMELLASNTQVPITHVPYKGGSAHTADVVSGLVSGIFENPSSALPLVRSGKYVPIAVTSSKRSAALPDVPTVAESGVSDFEVINWFGLFAPAGISGEVAQRMAHELKQALSAPDLRQRFANDGVDVGGPMLADFGAFVADETAKWGDIVQRRGIRGDQ
ncbi:tripartite tricarboxylate transporter substrate binding protein [Orrella sp. JC864]|uniref:tripartite tricarboxylate transporter substrate binding protein n=1 Tax=Orrella sp. JC864 TaxID=3120298 RepID=UPI00300B8A87